MFRLIKYLASKNSWLFTSATVQTVQTVHKDLVQAVQTVHKDLVQTVQAVHKDLVQTVQTVQTVQVVQTVHKDLVQAVGSVIIPHNVKYKILKWHSVDDILVFDIAHIYWSLENSASVCY